MHLYSIISMFINQSHPCLYKNTATWSLQKPKIDIDILVSKSVGIWHTYISYLHHVTQPRRRINRNSQ